MFCFTQNKIPGGLLSGAGAALAEAGRAQAPAADIHSATGPYIVQ